MTFKEAFYRIKQERPGATFKLNAEMWHVPGRVPEDYVLWSIWDAEKREHYHGLTPEEAVLKCLAPDDTEACERTLDAVKDLSA